MKADRDVRIFKAKDWFEGNEPYLGNNGTPSDFSEETRLAICKITKTPNWEKVVSHVGKKGEEVLEVALEYDGLFIGIQEGKSFPKSIQHSMVMFPAGNEFRVYILKVTSDDPDYVFKEEDYLSVNYSSARSDFSGDFRFFEWDESFIGGFGVENGIRVRQIIRQSPKSKASKY